MEHATDRFINLTRDNHNGQEKGIYSICSAHPMVLEASMIQAKEDDSILLVESTSNQVDQYGGYTGMKPNEFSAYVRGIAGKVGFPIGNLLLGGDHLGPNAWQKEPAAAAMTKANVLIRDYVHAGYTKIHLDASMFCADDPGDRTKPMPDEIVAARAAELCRTAEETWKETGGKGPKPVYIIGTEVPIPGGAQEEEDAVIPTSPEAAEKTLQVSKERFAMYGLEDAWERVTGLVVQPGVEFGDDQVFMYDREHPRAAGLGKLIKNYPGMVFEAHSTDYQTETALSNLVTDHFCILKVGPWVTFAYREAIFALSYIEEELLGGKSGIELSNIRKVIDDIMLANPGYWGKYYPGNESEQLFKRKYSFSDRSRYYWPDKTIKAGISQLITNLDSTNIPLSILSQFMPGQYTQVSEGLIKSDVHSLIISKIRDVTGIYARACRLGNFSM